MEIRLLRLSIIRRSAKPNILLLRNLRLHLLLLGRRLLLLSLYLLRLTLLHLLLSLCLCLLLQMRRQRELGGPRPAQTCQPLCSIACQTTRSRRLRLL